MAQAGVKGYEVEVITRDKDWLRKELELVAAMVSQIGITYKIKNMDMGGFNNLWLNRRFEQNARGHHPGGARSRRHVMVVPAQQGHGNRLQQSGDGCPARRSARASSTRPSARRCTTRSSTRRSRSAR